MEFKLGDIVKLKSGGPSMTVEESDPTENKTKDSLSVVFFAGNDLRRLIIRRDNLFKLDSDGNPVPESVAAISAGPKK